MKLTFITCSLCLASVLLNSCIRLSSPERKVLTASSTVRLETPSTDWTYWRGPSGCGQSTETGLPDELNGSEIWTHQIKGAGVPVIAGGRVYQFGYLGEGEGLQESLSCLDLQSGEPLWERKHSDFISDIVYDRYGVGAACIDPESGNVFFQTSPGLLAGYAPDGSLLWMRSMMEEFGRLTFPNGRTGGPCVDENLVIVHGITANWGGSGPARDRFYAFDKASGNLVWTSTPGTAPKDSSFAPLVFEDLSDGRRVFYSGTGCGHVVCVDARTGQPLWRFKMSHGGVNAGVVLHQDLVIAIHGKENLDSSRIGRMVAIRKPFRLPEAEEPILELGLSDEAWRNEEMESFTSSPVLHSDRIYTTVKTGELRCNDAEDGRTIWTLKLGPDQIHASPVWADGKLYAPTFEGKVFVVRDNGDYGEVVNEIDLGSACLASPAIAQGRIFIQTKDRLHCFGTDREPRPFTLHPVLSGASDATPVSLQVVPSEFDLKAGESIDFRVYALDRAGRRIKQLGEGLSWEKWIPPTAKVRSQLDGKLSPDGPGRFSAEENASLSAGAIRVTFEDLSGVTRGRVFPALPYSEDFESGYETNQQGSDGISFAYPPLPWLGARMRWQVQNFDGQMVAGNALDLVLFQRAINFVGSWKAKNYTVEVDALVDGNQRIKSTVGVINQRYVFALVGNSNKLEVFSNFDRFVRSTPFFIVANKWYRLKTRVDLLDDGSGWIRAKAWPKEEPEPDAWTLEERHARAHKNGAPGIYALSPQSKKKVYFDNLLIRPNAGSFQLGNQ